jgi:hypothetical protein
MSIYVYFVGKSIIHSSEEEYLPMHRASLSEKKESPTPTFAIVYWHSLYRFDLTFSRIRLPEEQRAFHLVLTLLYLLASLSPIGNCHFMRNNLYYAYMCTLKPYCGCGRGCDVDTNTRIHAFTLVSFLNRSLVSVYVQHIMLS